jgi:hypothetical protein
MVDPHMMKVAHVESIVDLERFGVNNAVGCYFFLDVRQQGFPYSSLYCRKRQESMRTLAWTMIWCL